MKWLDELVVLWGEPRIHFSDVAMRDDNEQRYWKTGWTWFVKMDDGMVRNHSVGWYRYSSRTQVGGHHWKVSLSTHTPKPYVRLEFQDAEPPSDELMERLINLVDFKVTA